jgi:hypothetical protein
MLTWREFRDAQPDLAEAGRALFYQFGTVGLGFLATVRRDGGPRVHPMCPLITDDALLAYIEPGPKRGDLFRDGRYAMHGFPPDKNEDAIYLTGIARPVGADDERRAAGDAQWAKERSMDAMPPQMAHTRLFEFLIDTCLVTRTKGHGDWSPQHTVWRAPQ